MTVETFPILYKRTSTGAIQQWQQEINEDDPSQYRTISGQVQGKLVKSEWKTCETTNEGKKNERLPDAQAVFEVKANYKKKLDVDYHKDINDIDNPKIFKPTLAKEYKAHKKKVDFVDQIWFSQPKLDGMRCVASRYGLFSRNGKPIYNAPHIHSALMRFFVQFNDLVIDGELYNHDYKEDFNTIISHCKKQKQKEEDIAAAREIIEYHVYDITTVDASQTMQRYQERYDDLKRLAEMASSEVDYIKLVPTERIVGPSHADDLYAAYLAEGYEGQMLRNNHFYENKRTANLLKRKESQDAEFILIDIQEGAGNYAGIAKRAILALEDGRQFAAGITGTQEANRELLLNKNEYLGTPTTVVFFDYTPDGVPRFGRVKEFNRNDN